MVKAASFVTSFSGKLGEEWVSRLLTPAFLFWLGGGLAVIDRWGWQRLETQVQELNLSETEEIIGLVLVLIVIAVSSLVMERFSYPTLRFLEGYWPQFLAPIRLLPQGYQRWRWQRINQRFQALSRKRRQNALNPQERLEFSRISQERQNYPTPLDASTHGDPLANLMPTQLGNVLRVAEDWPRERYGLETIDCWPRLWLLLPERTQGELVAVRQELDNAALVWLWGLLFWGWAVWVWWAIPVGLGVMGLGYRWALQNAAIYRDLLRATFDIYRWELYRGLRWPLPKDPMDELTQGQQLSRYLRDVGDRPYPQFTDLDRSEKD